MRVFLQTFFLWLALAVLSFTFATVAAYPDPTVWMFSGWLLLPALAGWLTVELIVSLPKNWFLQAAFWTVTLTGWVSAVLCARHRAGAVLTGELPMALVFGLAGVTAGWRAFKVRSSLDWRVLGETAGWMAAGMTVPFFVVAGWALSYTAKTSGILREAERRWAAMGLPLAEFTKTHPVGRENAGSEVARQVLRDVVGGGYYKERKNPAAGCSSEAQEIVNKVEIVSGKYSDAIELSVPAVEAITPLIPTLETAYDRILAAEPPGWNSNPDDLFDVAVPNFVGVRVFIQLVSADARRRLSVGDVHGAEHAVAAGLRLGKSLRESPTLVALMLSLAVDAVFTSSQVRLPIAEDGFESVAHDLPILRARMLEMLRQESWGAWRTCDEYASGRKPFDATVDFLPKWAGRMASRFVACRQLAVATLNGAEHQAIHLSEAMLRLPDFGNSLHETVEAKNPTTMSPNFTRAAMRLYATLLLREQTELIRDARARLASGRAVESRDSVVLPGLRWEMTTNAGKDAVFLRLAGAPEWILKGDVAPNEFWCLPIDGSVPWQFRLPGKAVAN